MTGIIVIISLLFWIESHWIAVHLFHVSTDQIREETAGSMRIIAVSLPFVIAQTVLLA